MEQKEKRNRKNIYLMKVSGNVLLFEISWEICNKVGGIYTVISSKSIEAVRYFGENYFLVGPDFNNNDFVELYDHRRNTALHNLRAKGIYCRFGYWNIPSKPYTILIDYKKYKNGYHELNNLLLHYNIDLQVEKWDGAECSIFGMVAGKAIAELSGLELFKGKPIISHFHEWMCGTGILYQKKMNTRIQNIFTTHATSIGRYLSKKKINIFQKMEVINSDFEAVRYRISTKHLIEKASALYCDIFTTVSRLTQKEAYHFLGRQPEFITTNALNMNDFIPVNVNSNNARNSKLEIIQNINHALKWKLADETKIIFYSGRAEFVNKGLDTLLESLKVLEDSLSGKQIPVVFIAVILMQPNKTLCLTPSKEYFKERAVEDNTNGYYQLTKAFLSKSFEKLSLFNSQDFSYLFIPSFLDGNDGVINMDYKTFLPHCDIGVYPSIYEPWGYTAHETALSGVPTITSDLSGFGIWVKEYAPSTSGIYVITHKKGDNTIEELKNSMLEILTAEKRQWNEMKENVRKLALQCTWPKIYTEHLKCYKSLIAGTHVDYKAIEHELQ